MNNEIFSIDPKTEEETTMNEVNFLYETLKKKMKNFLDTASDMEITDTGEFRKLKEKRDNFKNQLMLLQKKCNELTEEKLRISSVITEVTQMTDQKQKLDLKKYKKQKRTHSEQEPTPYHNTICCICDSNCHENCCAAMSGDHCKECDHHYTSHVHMRVKWVKKEQLVDVLDMEQLKLIEKASTDIDSKNQLLQSLNATVDKYEKEIASKQTEIKDLIIQMKDICSDFNYAKEIDLSMKILQERIEAEQVKKNTELVGLIHITLEYFKTLKSFVDQLGFSLTKTQKKTENENIFHHQWMSEYSTKRQTMLLDEEWYIQMLIQFIYFPKEQFSYFLLQKCYLIKIHIQSNIKIKNKRTRKISFLE
ncbi:hypothetical protein RFI_30371 [Reticulomyxa filosa]|uniref:Uncharacterized protein n=1 Tax=Reticulomyxa filosa TaxID=46433 RepID=X6M091_RETFI|nr:hypothetical protein RFI_30371 [Reticulomyxa filosa]|eukprot:ETO07021.1 hypothetical protein RFI_30371 [Reticulomyxa filosa]